MESISEIYLNHFGSLDSRNRVEYELHAISRMLNITGIDEIDWSKFSRGDILSIAASAGFRAKRPNSQNFTLRILKGLCNEAYLAGLLPESRYLAIADIRTVRGERKSQRRVPGHSEILNILKNCDDDPIGIRDAAIISVAVGCGLRRTEITDLKCTDVDLERQELRIIGKGNKERYVFFCDAVSERLRAWHNLRGDDGASFFFVPVHKTGRLLAERHMSDETVYQIIRRRSAEVLPNPISPHDIRRSFASQLLDHDVDLNTVRIAMGHSDIRTTQIYDKRDEMERLRRIGSIRLL